MVSIEPTSILVLVDVEEISELSVIVLKVTVLLATDDVMSVLSVILLPVLVLLASVVLVIVELVDVELVKDELFIAEDVALLVMRLLVAI